MLILIAAFFCWRCKFRDKKKTLENKSKVSNINPALVQFWIIPYSLTCPCQFLYPALYNPASTIALCRSLLTMPFANLSL